MTATSIEWTDVTWNPARGCSRVSAGCQHCYAEAYASRNLPGSRSPTTGKPFAVRKADGAHWTGKVELIPSKLDEPLRWRKPRKVFVNSMSDLFHESLPDAAIDQIFSTMIKSQRHTFQVLTKRPDRMGGWVRCRDFHPAQVKNIWLGVSVEDQATADERIPLLLQTPAAVRFVSYEPALGPVSFGEYGWLSGCDACCNGDRCPGPPECNRFNRRSCLVCQGTANGHNIDWLIVGGESGPGARPFDIAWARQAVRQCREAGVACFVKQLGARPCISAPQPAVGAFAEHVRFRRTDASTADVILASKKGGDPDEWPEDLRVREFPALKESA